MKTIIKENERNIMYHCTGITKFTGCQCFKDCTCREDFVPREYDNSIVKRKNKKTTYHNDLEDAEKRWDFINSL